MNVTSLLYKADHSSKSVLIRIQIIKKLQLLAGVKELVHVFHVVQFNKLIHSVITTKKLNNLVPWGKPLESKLIEAGAHSD